MDELINLLKSGIPILSVIVILATICTYLPKKIQDFLGITAMCAVIMGIMVGLFLYFSVLIGMFVSFFT